MESKALVEVDNDTRLQVVYHGVLEQLEEIKQQNSELVFDYEDPAENKMARSYVARLRRLKGETDRARKAEKQASLDYGRKVDDAAKKITAKIEEMIDVHAIPIKAIEDREVARVEGIRKRIEELNAHQEIPPETSSRQIHAILRIVEETEIDTTFEEFMAEAVAVKVETMEILQEKLEKAEKREADEAELERLRKAEADRQQKEREEQIRKEAAEKAERESREREERIRRESEEREREQENEIRRQEEARKRAEDEAARLRQEEQDRILRKEQEKAALIEKRNQIRGDIYNAIVNCGVNPMFADVLVVEILEGRIPHLKVTA